MLFCRGLRNQHEHTSLIKIEGVESKEEVGKSFAWISEAFQRASVTELLLQCSSCRLPAAGGHSSDAQASAVLKPNRTTAGRCLQQAGLL